MTVKQYEIDMLNVKDADAFLIHFFDENDKEYVVLVDGGRYEDGPTVSNYERRKYPQRGHQHRHRLQCESRRHQGGEHF